MNRNISSRFRPRVEALEDRELMTVGLSIDGGTLTLTPDSGFNRIFLGNDGNGHITGFTTGIGALNGGAGFSGVDQVIIEGGKGGRCEISYGQLGDQIRPFGLYEFAASTNDFTADMNGHAIKSNLFLTANGGAGHNTFSVNAAGVNLTAGTFGVDVGGGEGPATISVVYSGVKSKNAKLGFTTLSGRDSGNSINVNATIRSDPSEGTRPAGLRDCGFLVGDPGDRGRDTGKTNVFSVRIDSDLPLSTDLKNPGAMVQGGRGRNLAFITPNVTVSGCQQFSADAFNPLRLGHFVKAPPLGGGLGHVVHF
jgi:hypothetical protein